MNHRRATEKNNPPAVRGAGRFCRTVSRSHLASNLAMDNLSAVEAIFFAALNKRSPEERAAYLAAACGPDSELRRSVERLLDVQPKVGSFLQGVAPAIAAAAEDRLVGEGPGSSIGPYKLLEQIGEGGFGVVFLAEQQQPVRRKVALKVLKPGMDTRQVVARFEAERQALALMDHPRSEERRVGKECRTRWWL